MVRVLIKGHKLESSYSHFESSYSHVVITFSVQKFKGLVLVPKRYWGFSGV